MLRHRRLGGIILAILLPVVVWAGNLILPFTFQSGTPIRASEMNANFAAVKQAVDELDARVSGSGTGLLRSGTRLKQITLEGADGVSATGVFSFPIFWDSQLHTACLVAGFRYTHCLPAPGAGVAFSDPACSNQVGYVYDTGQNFERVAPDGGYRWYAQTLEADAGITYLELGDAAPNLVPLFNSYQQLLSDGGSISMCSTGSTGRTAPIIRMVPVTDLAPISFHVQ